VLPTSNQVEAMPVFEVHPMPWLPCMGSSSDRWRSDLAASYLLLRSGGSAISAP
jgi:hypothetical protein